ncbi:MAG: hypothetical protein PHD72_04750 [Patescibacteria group bacterium]|nr:hypothetical protein [Patescibacteria group bacterium]
MSPLSESIKKTLTYFSLFDYPLTKEELFAYLWQPPWLGYEEYLSAPLAGAAEKGGYWFIPGQEANTENRRRRLLVSELKLKIARQAVKKIRSVPFLRAVFVCNSVGSGLAETNSDVDFFIITAPRRIWLVRFFTNLILKFFGLRTYGQNSRDKICLSFFVDSEHLNLSPLKVEEEDVHFIYWLHQMIPVYDPENYYAKFLSANEWAKKYLPNVARKSSGAYLSAVKDSIIGSGWKKMWEKMWGGGYGGLLESQVKAVQSQRLKAGVKTAAAKRDNSVVISDAVLKFHENDTRKSIFENWKSKI